MAQAIARRMVKKMANDSSSKSLLFGKTFMSNSAGSIPPYQSTRNTIRTFSPLTNKNHHHFLHPSATTTRRNLYSVFSEPDKHLYDTRKKYESVIPPKYLFWLGVPVGIMIIISGLHTVIRPYCKPTPDIDREDQVRYRFRLEKGVRQENVKFKIVDNSVLELSYMYRHYTNRRIVKRKLPKGNYASAEVKGWLTEYDMFLVDITGFQREKLSDSEATSSDEHIELSMWLRALTAQAQRRNYQGTKYLFVQEKLIQFGVVDVYIDRS